MNWGLHIDKLRKGETVAFRPKGHSMMPKIESGQKVTVSPDISNLKEGDIVFCRVRGCHYVHLIKAEKVDGEKKLYLIGNNRGGTNGWVTTSGIFGRVIEISD